MKNIFLAALALTAMGAAPETPVDDQLKGAWKVVHARYGDEPVKDYGKLED